MIFASRSYFWNDDFYFFREVQKRGYWELTKLLYFNWDGRILSVQSFIRLFLIFNFTPFQITLVSTATIFALSWVLLEIIRILLNLKRESFSKSVINTLILGFLFWLVFSPHLAFSHYWATGTFYAFHNLIFFVCLWLLMKEKKSNLLFLISVVFLVSGGMYSAICLFIFYFGFLFWFEKRNLQKNDFWFLLIFTFTFFINVMAPGNYSRMELTSIPFEFTPKLILSNYYFILRTSIGISFWAIISGFLFSFKFDLTKIPSLNNSFYLKIILLFTLSSLVSILPFSVIPGTFLRYLGMHFQIFSFLGSFFFCLFLRQKFKLSFKETDLVTNYIILISFFIISGNQYFLGKNVNEQVIERHKILIKNQGLSDTVFIPPLEYPKGFFTHISYEISEDPKADHNLRLQDWFGCGPVVLK